LLENTSIRFVHLNVALPLNDENGLYIPPGADFVRPAAYGVSFSQRIR
jgi:hypothetical protein